MDDNTTNQGEHLEVKNFSESIKVNNVINEYLENGRLLVDKHDLDPQQMSDVFQGVKEAISVYQDALEKQGADAKPSDEEEQDGVRGAGSASNAPAHTHAPTEDDFDLPVAVSQEVDREALTIMAVSLAKTLRGMNVRVISNRKEVIVSMADKAIKLSDVIFGTLLYCLKKNLMAMVKGARGLDSIKSGFEYHGNSQNPRVLRNLIWGISVIQSFTDCSGAAVIRLNLTRVEVYDNYQCLLKTLDSDRESALKANLLEAFKVLNGGPRRPGQKNETVALKVLEQHLGISADDVRKIIKAAKLSWILASVWGRGSVMFLPANKSGHTTLIGYLSAIEQVLKAACEHDGGLFRRLSETLDELIIGPIANSERLAIKQPSAKEARRLEESCISDIIDYVRCSAIEDGSDEADIMEVDDSDGM